MEHGVALTVCVFFLGSACGALLVALQRYAYRAKMLHEFTEELSKRERARLVLHQWLEGIRLMEIDPRAADDRIDRWR